MMESSVPPAADAAIPPAAYAAVLACLPGIGPIGLAELVRRHDPQTAWELILRGDVGRSNTRTAGRVARPEAAGASWSVAARGVDVAARWRWLQDGGIGVTF